MKIKLDEGRNNLREGRTTGIGFAFLKKEGEDFFRGVQPISPCKDYLNDVVYTERTGKSIGVYGLTTKKEGIFDESAHVAVAVCPNQSGSKHSEFASELKMLSENMPKVEKLMNIIEDKIGIKQKTKLANASENLVYAHISSDWTTSTWMANMWAFLFRNFLYCADEDPYKALEGSEISCDSINAKKVVKAIEKIAKGGLPKQDMASFGSDSYSIHGAGVINYTQS